MLHRYSNAEYVMEMDLIDGMNMIVKAQRKINEDKLYLMYCTYLPMMDKNTYITFQQFLDKTSFNRSQIDNKTLSNRSADELLAEANLIRNGKKMN